MYRTYVIIRHTFFEAIVQPVFSLMLGLGAFVLLVFAALPFFTLGEDTKMFKAVGLDVVLLLVLVSTLFATSRTIFDEIEDRTMLTLMSKPIFKWEVIAGKYLGIILSALLAVAVLGVVLGASLYWRIPTDAQLRVTTLDDRELLQIHDLRMMHLAGLYPSLVLVWLQISVLAALGVALSTRFSLVVNLPVVLILYVAGNLLRFLFPLTGRGSPMGDRSVVTKTVVWVLSLFLPYLEIFDLRADTVYKPIRLSGSQMFADDPQGVFLHTIWLYVATAALYCITYSVFSLAAGMWMFQTRELGGAEG